MSESVTKTKRLVTDPPSDLVPMCASTIILTEVDDNGKLSGYAKTFPKYLLSFEATATKETEDLETGCGANEPFVLSESYDITATVNALNLMFHSLASGKKIKIGAKAVRTFKAITITKDDTSSTYQYKFEEAEKPVAKTTGGTDYRIVLTDAKGRELQDVGTSTEELAFGQYKYDATTSIITVSSEYENEKLEALYYTSSDAVFSSFNDGNISNKLYQLECISIMQSANFGTVYQRVQTFSRVKTNGDVAESTAQKGINANLAYAFKSVTPATGENAYDDDYYLFEG